MVESTDTARFRANQDGAIGNDDGASPHLVAVRLDSTAVHLLLLSKEIKNQITKANRKKNSLEKKFLLNRDKEEKRWSNGNVFLMEIWSQKRILF